MLTEFTGVRQIPGEGKRRWFRNTDLDLILWYSEHDPHEIEGFQLCYDKQGLERALTWHKDRGYQHHRVDNGEHPYSPKQTPILVQDGSFDTPTALQQFRAASSQLDAKVTQLIETVLKKYVDRQ